MISFVGISLVTKVSVLVIVVVVFIKDEICDEITARLDNCNETLFYWRAVVVARWIEFLLPTRHNPASNSELAIFMEQTLTVKCREKINLSKKRPEITHNWPGWDNNKTINKAKVSPARRSGTSESCPSSSSSSVTATRISSSGSLEDLRCTEMVKTFRIETGKRSRLVRPSLDQLIHFVHGYDQLNKDIKALTCMFLLGIS